MAMKVEGGQDASVEFSQQFLQLLRLLRLYDTENVTFDEPIAKFQALITGISDRAGSARLQSEEGVLFFNKDPVRGGRRAYGTIQGLVKEMERNGLAEIAFMGAVSKADLKAFFGFLRPPEGQDAVPLSEVKERIAAAGFKDKVQVYAPGETTGSAQARQVEIDEASYFPLAYARTLVLLREYVKHQRTEELNRYFTQKLHRALQELCNLVNKYPHKFVAMASVKGVDDYLFNHMANTGLMSVVLGFKLGVGRVSLSDLGLAGMLHALGQFRGDHALIGRSELSKEQKSEAGRHPYRLLGAVLEGRKVTKKILVAAAVGFEYDLHRGWTKLRQKPAKLHPFTHIVRVCEVYDALTTSLPDRQALLPDQALKKLIGAPAGVFDPLVLAVFTNLLGLFPTGTCVTLSSGEVAVVVHPNPEKPKRPLVAIVMDRDGLPKDGEFLDLAQKVEGHYPATITGSIDPAELGINVPDYLLG